MPKAVRSAAQALGAPDFGAMGKEPQLPHSRPGQGMGTPGALVALRDCLGILSSVHPGSSIRNLVALLTWSGTAGKV